MMKIANISFSLLMLFAWAVMAHAQQVDESLVLALSFDEGSGSVANDASRYGFDGKVENGNWVDGKFGKALEFNGSDSMVEVDDDPKLLLLEGGTIMAWAYIMTEAGHASWPRIAIKSNTNGGTNGYDFLFDRANAYALRFCVGGACNSYEPVETEGWHHCAATFDGSEINIYLDGENVGNLAQPGAAIDTTGSPLHIGNGSAADRAYHGILDEVRIFDVALDEDEVQWHMDRGTTEVLAVEPHSKLTATWAEIKSE